MKTFILITILAIGVISCEDPVEENRLLGDYSFVSSNPFRETEFSFTVSQQGGQYVIKNAKGKTASESTLTDYVGTITVNDNTIQEVKLTGGAEIKIVNITQSSDAFYKFAMAERIEAGGKVYNMMPITKL